MSTLETVVLKTLEMFPNEVKKYKAGEKRFLGLFIGYVMKLDRGIDREELKKLFKKKLE